MVEQWHIQCRILALNKEACLPEHGPSFLPPIIPFMELSGVLSDPLIVIDHPVMQAVGAELRTQATTRSKNPERFADGISYIILEAMINTEAKNRCEPSGLEWQCASVCVDNTQLRIACMQLRYGRRDVVYPDNSRALGMVVAQEASRATAEFQDFTITVANDNVRIPKRIAVVPFRRRIHRDLVPS